MIMITVFIIILM